MTADKLRARLSQFVASAEDDRWATTYTGGRPVAEVAIPDAIRPVRRLVGQTPDEETARIFSQTPRRYMDVWIHRKAAIRREEQVLTEAARRDVDLSTFDGARLDHPASWGLAQLDPPESRPRA